MSGYRKCPWAPCPYNSNRNSSLTRHITRCRYRNLHSSVYEEAQSGSKPPESDSITWQINLHNELGQLQERLCPSNMGHEGDPPGLGECDHSEDDLVRQEHADLSKSLTLIRYSYRKAPEKKHDIITNTLCLR
jgi:hypothetical protein